MVYISIPHQGDITIGLAERLLDFDTNDEVEVSFSYARPVDANRCKIVDEFLETDHEYLMMVDSDIVPPQDVLDLVGKADVVSPLIFSMRQGVPYPVVSVANDDDKFVMYSGETDDVLNVDGVGTGCIIIHRSVFDDIDKPWFRYVKNEHGRIDTGEDYDFCQRVRDAGRTIRVYTEYVAGHKSEVDLSEILRTMTLAIETQPSDIKK